MKSIAVQVKRLRFLFCTIVALFNISSLLAADDIIVIPDKEVIDVGTCAIGEYGAVSSVTFKVASDGFLYDVEIGGPGVNDFYIYKRPFFDENNEATAQVMFHPQSRGVKELHLVLKKDGVALRTVKFVGEGISDSDPIITTDYMELDYSQVEIGTEKSIDVEVHLQNCAEINTYFEGTHANEFYVEKKLDASLEVQKLRVFFKPTVEGDKEASLVFQSGDIRKILSISAKAIYPQEDLFTSTTQIRFSDTHINEVSKSQFVEVEYLNMVQPPQLLFEGEEAESFQVIGTIPQGSGNKKLELVFCPKKIGENTATFKVKGREKCIEIQISGLCIDNVPVEITSDTQVLDFGRVEINSYISKDLFITVTNSSEIPVAEITGTDKDDFGILTSPGSGKSKMIVDFLPTSTGVKNAVLKISLGDALLEIPIKAECYGPDPIITVDKTELVFDDTEINSSSVERGVNLTLQYVSDDLNLTVVGENAGEFVLSKDVIPHDIYDGFFTVTFKPVTEGNKQAKVIISNSVFTHEVLLRGKAIKKSVNIDTVNAGSFWDTSNKGCLVLVTEQVGGELSVYSLNGELCYSCQVHEKVLTVNLQPGLYIAKYKNEKVKLLIE